MRLSVYSVKLCVTKVDIACLKLALGASIGIIYRHLNALPRFTTSFKWRIYEFFFTFAANTTVLARKKKRYRSIKLGISTQKAEKFAQFCASKGMTPNLYLRKVIDVNLAGFKGYEKKEQKNPRQLGIFDFIEP